VKDGEAVARDTGPGRSVVQDGGVERQNPHTVSHRFDTHSRRGHEGGLAGARALRPARRTADAGRIKGEAGSVNRTRTGERIVLKERRDFPVFNLVGR
jgi:hypothetical protein